ncbi:hypothetical protein B9G55_08400 [Saccharibacillus sp. O16]|nr:hypothetical protein B9G55_08400 [Saccharibacillus sp. O16]
MVIRRPVRADEASAQQLFRLSITDAFRQEGLSDHEEEMAYEISHKAKLLQAAFEASENEQTAAQAELDTRGVPVQPIFLIAALEGQVLGTISFGPSGKQARELSQGRLNEVGELGSLYIRPDYQNLGIGSRLIAAMMSELEARGIQSFCLDSGYGRAQQRWRRKFGEPYLWVEDHWGPGGHHAVWHCRVDEM